MRKIFAVIISFLVLISGVVGCFADDYAGVVVLDDGSFGYINSANTLVTSRMYCISDKKTNGLIPAGVYIADADGRLTAFTGFYEGKYLVDGQLCYGGIIFDENGYMYYVNSSATVIAGRDYPISKDNGYDLKGMILRFDVDGRAYAGDANGRRLYYVKDENSPVGLGVRPDF